ncbi:MAG: S41 family peptidase [Planctomycetota bacterium]
MKPQILLNTKLLVALLVSLIPFCAETGTAYSADASSPVVVRMPADPSISSDGSKLAFAWAGEIWTANVDGTQVQRLTNSDAMESKPLFSPDDERIAFISNRTGSSQVFVMNADGTEVRQVSFHSAGYTLSDWFPDGKSVLALGSRDHYHRDATRMIRLNVDKREKEQILVDAMVEDAKLSPDGTKVLFTREGERWWRKGYEGERSAQVWMLDLETEEFKELLHEGVECMWPVWMPDGKGFYFTKGTLSGFELWRYRFSKRDDKPGKQKLVYGFEDDSIVYPSVAKDGKSLLFRHLFDLYMLNPTEDAPPQAIELQVQEDLELPEVDIKRELSSATDVAFTQDGLEIAMVVGGDVWVMDTTLREPKRVTSTGGYEEEVTFGPNGNEIWFTSVTDGKPDVWKAVRKDEERYWWQNDEFELENVTNDAQVESDLRFTPDGESLVFQQGRGDLAILDLESGKKRTLIRGFSGMDFDISSDSQWIAYSQQDDDFNYEIWITKLDGSMEPVNVSRHPDNESSPKFSPDGRILAFTGRRVDREVDIYYVYLQDEFDQETRRQRKIDEALELMKKRKSAAKPSKGKGFDPKAKDDSVKEADASKQDEKNKDDSEESESEDEESDEEADDLITIDFDDIHERLRKISIPDSFESGLLFSPDSKKLAFSASIDGQRGWYTVEFPNEMTPKFLTSSTGRDPVWSKEAGGILCLRNGVPTKVETNGKSESYSFEVAQTLTRDGWLAAGFDKAWLTMREVWYDTRFANKNWDAVRRKYADTAAAMRDTSGLAQVIQLMLGELNGSHLGFYPSGGSRRSSQPGWVEETAHLGLRFEEDFNGPGLLVRDVIEGGPCDRVESAVYAGDTILEIDGHVVDPDLDLTTILNGRMDRDITLKVGRASDDEESVVDEISIRPISYSRARSLLYPHWLDRNREAVEEASDGRLGYLHIRAMDMGSFYEFERQLYNVGYGKDGLVIDVRDNGGGSTTDLLLTALTQPRHAITVPRGGGQGYPHDRAVFASWNKPIIVLCNQNSYSNAEIFSHAIKTLGRGKVVGVQTAGGVVSTGSATINDVGRIRVPFRGWFLLNDGQDMERNGCLPDETVWPEPGELPAGVDRQLDRAVELLLSEVEELDLGDAALTYAAQRDLEESTSASDRDDQD